MTFVHQYGDIYKPLTHSAIHLVGSNPTMPSGYVASKSVDTARVIPNRIIKAPEYVYNAVQRGDTTHVLGGPKCRTFEGFPNFEIAVDYPEYIALTFRTGPKSHSDIIQNCIKGFTEDGKETIDRNIDHSAIFKAAMSTNFMEVGISLSEMSDIEKGIIAELNLHQHADIIARTAAAYVICCDVADKNDDIIFDREAYAKLFLDHNVFRPISIEDYIEQNGITISSMSDAKLSSSHYRSIFKFIAEDYSYSDIFHQAVALDGKICHSFRYLLFSKMPSTGYFHIWNAICLFRSILTSLEFEEMIAQLFHYKDSFTQDDVESTIVDMIKGTKPIGISHGKNSFGKIFYDFLKDNDHKNKSFFFDA